jgi:hypothetical protein
LGSACPFAAAPRSCCRLGLAAAAALAGLGTWQRRQRAAPLMAQVCSSKLSCPGETFCWPWRSAMFFFLCHRGGFGGGGGAQLGSLSVGGGGGCQYDSNGTCAACGGSGDATANSNLGAMGTTLVAAMATCTQGLVRGLQRAVFGVQRTRVLEASFVLHSLPCCTLTVVTCGAVLCWTGVPRHMHAAGDVWGRWRWRRRGVWLVLLWCRVQRDTAGGLAQPCHRCAQTHHCVDCHRGLLSFTSRRRAWTVLHPRVGQRPVETLRTTSRARP